MATLWRRVAVSRRAVVLFRTWLGVVVLLELCERLAVIPWMYTDAGAFPRSAVMPPRELAPLLHAVCVHAWSGSAKWQFTVVTVQAAAATALCIGKRPRAAAAVCWALHASSMLRNPQLAFIFDRYLHVLLLLAACLPTGPTQFRASAASCALAAQLVLIYVDAGSGKLTSPDRAWSLSAEVGALDTYLRHTPVARFSRWLLGTRALRFAGATVAWLEFTIAPLALAMPTELTRRLAIGAAASLHLGIALTMRNTVALSLVGIAAWLPFIDGPPVDNSRSRRDEAAATAMGRRVTGSDRLSAAVVALAAVGSVWHQLGGYGAPACAATASDAADLLQSTLLHNRWNVFTGAEAFVVWEVAPARLDDGSIVDLWRGTDTVAWDVPRGAAPPNRGGRWRSWPYLAQREPAAEAAFWGTLCDEWESRDARGRRVVSFVFYLLQADVLTAEQAPPDDMSSTQPWAGYQPAYGSVRKRRIRQFSCLERRQEVDARHHDAPAAEGASQRF